MKLKQKVGDGLCVYVLNLLPEVRTLPSLMVISLVKKGNIILSVCHQFFL